MRVWLAMFALALSVSDAFAAAAKRIPAGVVIAVEGTPKLTTPDGKQSNLKRGDYVHEGDKVETKKGERLGLALTGGAEFRIDEKSVFQVRSGGYGNTPANLFTEIGQAWTRLISGNAKIKVRTPLAVAAVRGTEADIDLDDPSRLTVKVYEGHVDLLSPDEKKTLQQLAAGQASDVAGGAASRPRQLSERDRGTWQQGIQADEKTLNDQMKRLEKEAEKTKTLRFQTPGGDIELPIEKKK